MFKIENGRSKFWQWDRNQRLTADVPAGCSVHIANDDSECAYVTEAYFDNETGAVYVDVPNALLQEAKPLQLWVYRNDGRQAYTSQYASFTVLPRKKPEDHLYTEEDRSTLQTAVSEALEELLAGGSIGGGNGKDGRDGRDGADGYTPVKGVDYWTQEDRQAMIDEVVEALPNAREMSY